MDDKLKQTLNKVVLLADKNLEFGNQLRKELGISYSIKYSTSIDKIDNIEKYLGLDFGVDDLPSVIDYNFIKERDIKAQLISDNREMMRNRYGTRYHTVCFDEFCRYAHMQVEMLLNYFYDKKEKGNLDKIIEHIKKYNQEAKISTDTKTLGSISYSVKLWSFKAEFKLDYDLYFILNCLRQLRNDSIHRSPEKEQKSVALIRQRLIKMRMPLRSDGNVDYYRLDKQSKQKYKEIRDCDWFKEYRYRLWLHEGSFDRVIETIEELKKIVKDLLSL